MWQQGETLFDAASAVSIGQRDCQEDAIILDCPRGGDLGLIVLCDGMGGHAAGDVASKIVVTEVFSDLKLRAGTAYDFDGDVCGALRRAALGANDCLQAYVEQYPETTGMGATLVAACVWRDRLNWLSVGDSSLFLYRKGTLRQLNEDHSYGAQLDKLVRDGKMDKDVAEHHPDRNCLTSVVSGHKIAHMDCPEDGLLLRDGDIVIVASDGLQHLGTERIRTVVSQREYASGIEIAGQFLREIEDLGDPDQDNVSVGVVKVRFARTARDAPAAQDAAVELVGDDAAPAALASRPLARRAPALELTRSNAR